MDVIITLEECQKKSGFSSKNYLTKKRFSFPYIRYRILRPIIKIRYKWFRFRKSPTPWLSPAAVLFFEKWLTKEMIGAEYGSGISTLFFAKRTKKMVSIEHYEPWFKKVSNLFAKKKITNVDYKFIPVDNLAKPNHKHWLYEMSGLTPKDFSIRWEYNKYFGALNAFEESFFDFILVDGRARPECVFAAVPKLKKKGLLVLDNSERKRYKLIFDFLKDWESYTTSNGLTDTTFWIKP